MQILTYIKESFFSISQNAWVFRFTVDCLIRKFRGSDDPYLHKKHILIYNQHVILT